jgi:hypothetical protein
MNYWQELGLLPTNLLIKSTKSTAMELQSWICGSGTVKASVTAFGTRPRVGTFHKQHVGVFIPLFFRVLGCCLSSLRICEQHLFDTRVGLESSSCGE